MSIFYADLVELRKAMQDAADKADIVARHAQDKGMERTAEWHFGRAEGLRSALSMLAHTKGHER